MNRRSRQSNNAVPPPSYQSSSLKAHLKPHRRGLEKRRTAKPPKSKDRHPQSRQSAGCRALISLPTEPLACPARVSCTMRARHSIQKPQSAKIAGVNSRLKLGLVDFASEEM